VKDIGSNLYTRKFNQCQCQDSGSVTSVQIWPGKGHSRGGGWCDCSVPHKNKIFVIAIARFSLSL